MTTKKRTRRPSLRRKELTVDDIKETVGKTWFNFELEGDRILLDTRDHGDVGEETPGKKDIEEGHRILRAIRKRCPVDTRRSSMECVDEWVHVEVFIEPRSESEIRERERKAAADKLLEKAKKWVEDKNAELTGKVDNSSNPIVVILTDFSRLKLSASVTYGERRRYHNHLKSQFALGTLERAREVADEFVSFMSEVEWTRSESGPQERLTYNTTPPSPIEVTGKVELEANL